MWTSEGAARFIDWMSDLQATLDQALTTRSGLHDAVAILKQRFGAEAVQKSATRFGVDQNAARHESRLRVTPAGLVGTSGLAVKAHTFHGG